MKGVQLAPVTAYLRANARLAQAAGITLVVVVMSIWLSMSARRTIAKADTETETAIAIRGTAERFSRQFVPVASAETDEWSRTTAQAAEYGVPMESRLALAGSVSRIAEAAGLTSVMVRFVGSDSVAAGSPRQMGEIVFQPAPFGMTLEGSGSALAVARTVLRLPPAVEISGLALSGDSDQLRATFSLAVYLSAGGPNN